MNNRQKILIQLSKLTTYYAVKIDEKCTWNTIQEGHQYKHAPWPALKMQVQQPCILYTDENIMQSGKMAWI